VEIVVACDPEADPPSLTMPKAVGGAPPGAPPGGGPEGPPGGGPGGGPGDPREGSAKTGSGPGKPPGGAPEPKLPPGAPKLPSTPMASPAMSLSAAQQKMLKEVHDKYGPSGSSRVSYIVKPGEQTYNVELK
jgi:hypothetical protein